MDALAERLRVLRDDNPEAIAALVDEGERYIAQGLLLDFARRSFPWYAAPPHIEFLADLLSRAERGEIRRLAISAPPGHGKSTLLTAFLGWFIGRDPHRRVLALSANEALARRNSRSVRAVLRDPSWPWPDVKLLGESLEEWQTSEGGGVRAIGQTGTVTGFRAEMFLCDDVQPDGGSETSRADLETWFRTVLTNRLEPGGIAVIINTRWTDDDLIGRIMAGESAGQWMHVNLAAIAGEGDILGRESGEALWPQRWPLEALAEIKAEMGSAAFEAQYQGNPVPEGGQTFLAEWLSHRYASEPKCLAKVMVVDSAWKTGPQNDYSVLATWGFDGRAYYVLDVVRGKWEFPELQRRVIERYHQLSPNAIVVEEAASGLAILQQLRAGTGLPLIAVRPAGSKESRAQAVTPYFEAGKVFLPERAGWLGEWVHEHLRFPADRHDDQVDTTSMALSYLSRYAAARRSDFSTGIGFMGR